MKRRNPIKKLSIEGMKVGDRVSVKGQTNIPDGVYVIGRVASQLGKLGKGKPKNISAAERKRRQQRMAEARKKRWPPKK